MIDFKTLQRACKFLIVTLMDKYGDFCTYHSSCGCTEEKCPLLKHDNEEEQSKEQTNKA